MDSLVFRDSRAERRGRTRPAVVKHRRGGWARAHPPEARSHAEALGRLVRADIAPQPDGAHLAAGPLAGGRERLDDAAKKPGKGERNPHANIATTPTPLLPDL